MTRTQSALQRTLAFHMAWGYPPAMGELLMQTDTKGEDVSVSEASEALRVLVETGRAIEMRGRHALPGYEHLIPEHERREGFFPRKIRRARRVATWLASLDGVRFVALCNTTALAHASDEADLDFFVVTKTGSIWQTRFFGVLPYKLMGRRPEERGGERDAVCLSFFVDDSALDLAPLMLPDGDPYFRYWFLSLLPLYDDGVSAELWKRNAELIRAHPLAKSWIASPDLRIETPGLRIPSFAAMERWAKNLQRNKFGAGIRDAMNKDTSVVVNDHVLKFHVEDGRAGFREKYLSICSQYGVEA